jgi:histidyl-tRNA synthetase
MENLETLMGKYGEEGDRLIFKILNNGLDNPSKIEQLQQDFKKVLEGKNIKGITERALRYDLTIPFARYVAMNYGQLTFPFKRYQMQPVWRADRPQRGRYREFYQCDADVVGSNSLLNETELTFIYATVFEKLKIPVEIKINSRKILAALAELCGGADKLIDITIAIDKLDKIGLEKVMEELQQRGLNAEQISTIENYLTRTETNQTELARMKKLMKDNAVGLAGIREIEYVLDRAESSIINCPLSIDFTLARGLNYYTGIIFEVKALGVQMGSIGGGGRYDDLTGLFGVANVPGVGISFGVDRIYDVMEELKLFPGAVQIGTQVLFFNLGENESSKAFELMQQLRNKGVRCEIYHETTKFEKQFKYADRKSIPYAIILGSKELEEDTTVVKDLRKGEQVIIKQEALLDFNFN